MHTQPMLKTQSPHYKMCYTFLQWFPDTLVEQVRPDKGEQQYVHMLRRKTE